MPNIRIEIPDTENSIARPVVLDVVRQLCEITGIPKNIRIIFPGDKSETYQQGSTIGELNQNVDRTNLAFNDQILIEVTEETHQGNMMLSEYRTDMFPLFLDNKIQVAIRPVKLSTDITLEIKFRSASKSQALNLKNRLEANIMSFGDINLHETEYHFSIPIHLVNLLNEIHRLRESVSGYGQAFDEYLSEHSKTNLTVIANQSGKSTALAYSEKQVRIQGIYDFQVAPQKGSNEDSASTWVTTFTYKFQYDKPIACSMVYPVIVHNQVLSKQYLIPDTAPNLDNKRRSFSAAGSANYYFETQNRSTAYGTPEKPITIPKFDEFKPNLLLTDTDTIYSALITVDSDNPKLLLNLNDLGDYALDPDIFTYLKTQYESLTVPYKCPFVVSLYKNGILSSDKNIYCDKDLNLISRTDLDLRDIHQVRLSVVTDIFTINQVSLKALIYNKPALIKTLLAMRVSMSDLKKLYFQIDFITIMRNYLENTGPTINEIFANSTQMNTVQSQYVVATKRDLMKKLKPTPLVERNDGNSDL